MLTANNDDNFFDNDIQIRTDLNIERNRIYFSRRKELKNLMKSINNYLDNNSQTLFLSLYYMDIIFTHKDFEEIFFSHFSAWDIYGSFNDISMNSYVLLSLACLIIASKFNENDPHVPTISSYIRLLYEYSKKKYIFNLASLVNAEVVLVKLLDYKLNYYTIYHYLIFFFAHGVIFKNTIVKSNIFKKCTEKKLLEKIYIQAREIIDSIIDSYKYFNLYFGKNNYIIVIGALLWSIENIMNIKIKNNENIFKLVYNLNIEENIIQEIYKIIEDISKNTNMNKRNKSTKLKHSIKTSSIVLNKPDKESESSGLFTNRNQISDMNYEYLEPKSNLPTIAFSKRKSYERPPQPKAIIKIIDNNNNDFNTCNRGIYNKLDKSSIRHHIPNQSLIDKNDSWVPLPTLNYMPNNRVYLTSIKNSNNNYQFNLENNDDIKKNIDFISDININNMESKKEPIDNIKSKIIKKSDYIHNNKDKIILKKTPQDKNQKKSFSYLKKKVYDYNMYYNPQARQSISSINDNSANKLMIRESSNNIKKYDNSIESNNYYYTLSQRDDYDEQKKIYEYKNLNENREPSNNSHYQPKLNNLNTLNYNNIVNYKNGDEIVNENNIIFDATGVKQNSEQEPQDNKRRSCKKKIIINREINTNLNKNYNKSKTIIVNNNIHINTLIDKNKLNLNKKNIINKSANKLILYKNPGETKINELYKQNIMNKLKNIRANQKKNINFNRTNKIHKSNNVFSNIVNNEYTQDNNYI